MERDQDLDTGPDAVEAGFADVEAMYPGVRFSPGIQPGMRKATRESDPVTGLPSSYTRASDQGYSQDHRRLAKVAYSHEAMIDMMVAEPRVTNIELASRFGYSTGWVSRIIGSDAFQAALAQRRSEVTDPFLIATVEERLKGLALQSLDIIADKLSTVGTLDSALKVADMSVKAMGFGARERNPGNVQNNFVVQLPAKAETTESWIKAAQSGAYNPQIIDQTPKVQESD